MSDVKKPASTSKSTAPAAAKEKATKQPSNSGKQSKKSVSRPVSQRVWPD